MIGLTGLGVYNSIYNITEENNKIELHTEPLDSDFSFTELEDKVAEVHGLSLISPEEVQYELYGPDIIKTYKIYR